MKPSVLKHKCISSVSVAMSFIVFVMPVLAQQDDLMAGRIAGEQAARADVNGGLWFAAGCFGNLTGIIVAYAFEPNPPAMHLLGKSPEYVAAYTDAYKATARLKQTTRAITGCIAGNVTALVAITIAARSSKDWAYQQ